MAYAVIPEHADPASIKSLLDALLAQWLFIHPSAIGRAERWMQDPKNCPQWEDRALGFRCGTGRMPRLTLEQMGALYLHLDSDPDGLDASVIIRQKHGVQVSVPAGWLYQVVNLNPCIKFEFGVYDYDQFCTNFDVSRDLISHYMAHPDNAKDNMWMQQVVVDNLRKVSSVLEVLVLDHPLS